MISLVVILIIDDSIQDREFLAAILTDAGHVVHTMPDGESGVLVCKNKKPDLVLVDMMMPGINGMDVLRAIKAEQPSIKVILCTSAGSEVSVALAMRIGADGYIVKPFDHDKILMNIQRSLGLK